MDLVLGKAGFRAVSAGEEVGRVGGVGLLRALSHTHLNKSAFKKMIPNTR